MKGHDTVEGRGPAASGASADLRAALRAARAQHRAGAGAVLDILLRGADDPSRLVAELASRAGVSVLLDPAGATPEFGAWTAASAKQWRCVVVRSRDGELLVAAEDPWDEGVLQRVGRAVPGGLPAAVAARACIDHWLAGAEGAMPRASGTQVEAAATNRAESSSGRGDAAEGPIVSFVDQALNAAFRLGASDVHFECDRASIGVKHRLDGVMVPFARMDGAELAQQVISRIKVLAQLDITERRLPQDGRFRFHLGDSAIDMRVSIMPSVHGEDAVLRLLDKSQLRGKDDRVTLDRLGFSISSADAIRALAGAPSGMLLVTGPTGSGKTTTVYAALYEINTGLEKIITIEDPVEYEKPARVFSR